MDLELIDSPTVTTSSELSAGSKKIRKHWTLLENKRYLDFVRENIHLLEKDNLSKGEKIFKKMSVCIESRSHTQCRSHHQKLLLKYKNISSIIDAHK